MNRTTLARAGGEPIDAAGRPYHLLARSGRAQWWRLPVELLLFGVLAFVFAGVFFGAVLALAALAGVPSRGDGFADPAWDLASGFGVVGVLLGAVALTVRWAGGRSLGTVSSVAGHVRWRWLSACVRPAFVLVGALTVSAVAVDWSWDPALWPGWRVYAAITAVSVLLVPFQAAAEEYVVRGWLVQAVVVWVRSRWLAAALSSALFVSLHAPLDFWNVADLSVFALAMCWVTFRTGGLEAALVLHVVTNNLEC